MGGAQPLAGKMAGAAILVVDVDPTRLQKRLDTGYLELEPLEDIGDWQPGDAHDAIAPGHGLTPRDIALLQRMAPPAAE